MHLFDLREPVNALSHGAGMMLALPVTWMLWKRCTAFDDCDQLVLENWRGSTRYQRNKALGLLIFGICLTLCYGVSATFHAVRLKGELLSRLQRLDHVGIYLLIAGTYTPVAVAILRGAWSWGTLATVWTIALVCRPGLVRRRIANLDLDPGLPDNGVGRLALLLRAGPRLLAPSALTTSRRGHSLQRRCHDQPRPVAGALAWLLRLSRIVPLLRHRRQCMPYLLHAQGRRPGVRTHPAARQD